MLEMLVGAGILLAGFLVGRVTRRPAETPRPKEISDPQPVCSGCTHHRSYHPQGGACVATVHAKVGKCQCGHAKSFHLSGVGACKHEDRTGWVDCGCRVFYSDESTAGDGGPCTCSEYHGPEPLPQFYAPALE